MPPTGPPGGGIAKARERNEKEDIAMKNNVNKVSSERIRYKQ